MCFAAVTLLYCQTDAKFTSEIVQLLESDRSLYIFCPLFKCIRHNLSFATDTNTSLLVCCLLNHGNQQVKSMLTDCVLAHSHCLLTTDPGSQVLLTAFGNNTLDF